MNQKIIIAFIVIILILAGGYWVWSQNTEQPTNNNPTLNNQQENSDNQGIDRPVKEFEIDSFTEIVDGQYFPQFSIKKITVNKGDLVRIKINVTNGRHDFKLDEFGIYENTPTGEITTIEFVADQTGEFIYYCNQPRHRELGHWGTLIVTE